MGLIRRSFALLATVVLLVLAFAGGWIVGFVRVGAAYDTASLTDVERQFSERMRDVSLVGTFTVFGRETRGADGRGGAGRTAPGNKYVELLDRNVAGELVRFHDAFLAQ